MKSTKELIRLGLMGLLFCMLMATVILPGCQPKHHLHKRSNLNETTKVFERADSLLRRGFMEYTVIYDTSTFTIIVPISKNSEITKTKSNAQKMD